MFSIEELSKSNRARRHISSCVADLAAMALILVMVLGPAIASASRPPTPENFRVTAQTAYTVTVAWNAPGITQATSTTIFREPTASLPPSCRNGHDPHLHATAFWQSVLVLHLCKGRRWKHIGNGLGDYQNASRYDTAVNGPVITVTEVGSNYVSVSLTPAQDDCPFLVYQYR